MLVETNLCRGSRFQPRTMYTAALPRSFPKRTLVRSGKLLNAPREDEMTKGELVRMLKLLPDEYEVHIEGQNIDTVELCTRGRALFNPITEAFQESRVEGVVNLLAEQVEEG